MVKLLILLSFSAWGFDQTKHPIYAQIIKNKPSINKKYAFELSNVIYKVSKQYRIPKRIFTAILMAESGYILSRTNCRKGLTNNLDNVIIEVCTDYGISQIHYESVISYGFDKELLLSDLNYSVEAGAKILSYFHRRFGHESDWWVRYNIGTRNKKKLRRAVNQYKTSVGRYL